MKLGETVLSKVTQCIRNGGLVQGRTMHQVGMGHEPKLFSFISSDVFCLLSKTMKRGEGNTAEDQEPRI